MSSLDETQPFASDRQTSTPTLTTHTSRLVMGNIVETIVALWRPSLVIICQPITTMTTTPQSKIAQQSQPPTHRLQLPTQQSQPTISQPQSLSQQAGTNTLSPWTTLSSTQYPISSYQFSPVAGLSHIPLFTQQPPMINPYFQQFHRPIP